MTQEFVTLPREVVEQALESLLNEGNFRKLMKPLIEESIKQIKAALEQPQGEQPPTTEQSSAVGVIGWKNHQPNSGTVVHWTTLMPPLGTKLYTHPQPKREPLTVEFNTAATGAKPGTPTWLVTAAFTRAVEASHNIK